MGGPGFHGAHSGAVLRTVDSYHGTPGEPRVGGIREPLLRHGECLYLIAGEPPRRTMRRLDRRSAASAARPDKPPTPVTEPPVAPEPARSFWIANSAANRGLLGDGTTCWCALKVGQIVSVVFAYSSPESAGGWSNGDTWEDFGGEVTHFAIVHLPGLPA